MTQTVKLISEEIQDVEYICEEKDGNRDYKIKGIFMQADVKNRNGRVYPMEVLQKEVNRYNKEYINEKRAFGELGHPDGPTVNLERASHMITGLYPDGKNFIGEAKVLSTPMGNIVKSLMDEPPLEIESFKIFFMLKIKILILFFFKFLQIFKG